MTRFGVLAAASFLFQAAFYYRRTSFYMRTPTGHVTRIEIQSGDKSLHSKTGHPDPPLSASSHRTRC